MKKLSTLILLITLPILTSCNSFPYVEDLYSSINPNKIMQVSKSNDNEETITLYNIEEKEDWAIDTWHFVKFNELIDTSMFSLIDGLKGKEITKVSHVEDSNWYRYAVNVTLKGTIEDMSLNEGYIVVSYRAFTAWSKKVEKADLICKVMLGDSLEEIDK